MQEVSDELVERMLGLRPGSTRQPPLPPGKYVMEITEGELRDNRSGNGRHIRLVLEVMDGEFKGREVCDYINTEHPNPLVLEIAAKRLSSIVRACCLPVISDVDELHHRPMLVDVRIRPAEGRWPASNEVKKYLPVPRWWQRK
jgi:hypothetical protein